MSFSSDVKKFAKKTGDELGTVARNIKVTLFTGVIMDTRVDTGRLRGNWQTSTGAPKYTEIDRIDKNVKGAPGGEAYNEAVKNVTAFGTDYMTNNLPYASVWEERDAMVAKNILRVKNNLKNRVRQYA